MTVSRFESIEPWGRLRMCKKLLRLKQMHSGALIADARSWANELVQREARGPGDTENAMRRLSSRYGVDFTTFWTLRYRPPKRIFADVYFGLQAAYRTECERQLRLLTHELEITKAARPDAAVVAEVEDALRSVTGQS